MIRSNSRRRHDDAAQCGKDEHRAHRARRRATAAVATIAGVGLLAGAPLASSASAASLPTVPAVNVAALDAALSAAPGVTPAQIQALESDLSGLQAGQAVPNLTGDINAIVTSIGQASGETPLLSPVLNTVAEIADGLLGGNVSAEQLEGLIVQLETLSGTNGVVPTVGGALAQLAAALTGADLTGLLGQSGSPLSSQAVQTIVSELESLQSLPADATIPAGALSGVAQALDTVAAAPNVPAAAASALEGVAGTLNSASGITPATLSAVLPTLASALPSVQSVPITGPALGSVLGGLTDELATSPPATAASSGGGPGGTGGSGGAAGTSTTTTPNYVTYLQSNSAQQASVKIGASIHAVSFSGDKLQVKMTCPAVLAGGCHTTIHLTVRSWSTAAKSVTIAAGKTRTVLVGLPQLATTAAKHGRAITVTATTGSYTTHKHTIHIKFKH
jgi:hypothetical protein